MTAGFSLESFNSLQILVLPYLLTISSTPIQFSGAPLLM